MFDIGWSEMAVIALLLLMVIGPRELPTMMRTVGRYVRKARMLTRDFQHSLDEMAREAELDEAKKTIQSAKSMNLERSFEETLDPDGEVKAEARALDAEARDNAPPTTANRAQEVKSNPDGAGNGSAAGKEASSEATAAGDEAPAERAEHRIQPANPAPPHSVTPPVEEGQVASKTGAG